jgi:hypothetical protein
MAARNFTRRASWLMPLAWLLAVGGGFFSAGISDAQTFEQTQAQFLHGDYAGAIQAAEKELAGNSYRNE